MVIKLRHKISFSAFEKRMTIPELLIKQVLDTYDIAINEGRIVEDPNKRNMQDKIFEQISCGVTG